jgi:nitroreductase
MDFRDILARRRSIRRFTDDEVGDEILSGLIDDAICAPSSGNEQPWRFIVVKDGNLLRRISDDSKRSILSRIEKNPSDYAKKYEKMLSNEEFKIFYDAPTVVFIVGDGSLKNSTVNCALAASYFMMSAADRGLGTCWINFATAITSPELLQTLGISEEDIIVAPIAVGYPDTIPSMPKRKKPGVTIIP